MALKLKIAKNWNELNFTQLQEISLILYKYQDQIDDLTKQKTKELELATYCNVIKHLLVSNGIFKYYAAIKELTFEHYQLYVKFIFNGIDRTLFTKAIIINNQAYYPPYARLANCTIGEFSHLDSMYYNWHHTQNPAYLNQLCATLYRVKDVNAHPHDIRVPFNKTTVNKHADAIATLPLKTRIAIAYCFIGCRNHIVGLYKTVFPESSNTQKSANKTKPKYVPFGQIISHKVNFDPSDIDTAYKLNVYTFFGMYENELQQI